MSVEGKVWGTTELVAINPAFECHRLEIVSGGYSSKHRHETKWNSFFVEKGTLLVRVWRSANRPDETVVRAGHWTQVEPGVPHQFEALEATTCFEHYWAQYNPCDIVRENVGGVRT